MKYLLDTDICVYWLKGRQEVREKIKEINLADLAISVITLGELQYGAYNSKKVSENLLRVNKFASFLQVYDIEKSCVEKFAMIKAKLRATGRLIDDFDLLIAATAIVNDCILVTNNLRHFERIENLTVVNWMKNG